jgi:hypothetical protein
VPPRETDSFLDGFDQRRADTWRIDDEGQTRFGDNPERLYLDIPRWEKDKAKSVANVRWEPSLSCCWIAPEEYTLRMATLEVVTDISYIQAKPSLFC